MLEILERSITFQDISLQTKLAPQFVNVSLLCKGCDTTYSVNRKGKRPTLNWLHIIIDMLSKTFHECKIDDSVDLACSYALLSYGKKGRYNVDTFDALRYTNAMTTDKSVAMLPQPKTYSCQISYLALVQEPRPKPRAD